VIGGLTAIVLFLLSGGISSWWRATPSGDQMEALFGSFSLGPKGYIAILSIAGGVAVLTGFVSRVIVFRHLRGLDGD
jgi:cell division transport system permease protein